MALTGLWNKMLRSCGFRSGDKPRQDRFLTEPEIVQHMMRRIDGNGEPTPERKSWSDVAYADLIQGHHTTGRHIRNYYQLWDRRNPLTETEHPDDVSLRIMQKVWCEVNAANWETMQKHVQRVVVKAGSVISTEITEIKSEGHTFPEEPALRPPQMSVAEHRRLRNAAIWDAIRGYVGR